MVTWEPQKGGKLGYTLPYNFLCPENINLASARLLSKQPCLVPNSMLVYIEVLMCLPPTMMAIVAEGTCPNSTYQPENLPTTHVTIEVMEVGVGFNSNTSPLIETPCSTLCNIQNCIVDPMHTANMINADPSILWPFFARLNAALHLLMLFLPPLLQNQIVIRSTAPMSYQCTPTPPLATTMLTKNQFILLQSTARLNIALPR